MTQEPTELKDDDGDDGFAAFMMAELIDSVALVVATLERIDFGMAGDIPILPELAGREASKLRRDLIYAQKVVDGLLDEIDLYSTSGRERP